MLYIAMNLPAQLPPHTYIYMYIHLSLSLSPPPHSSTSTARTAFSNHFGSGHILATTLPRTSASGTGP